MEKRIVTLGKTNVLKLRNALGFKSINDAIETYGLATKARKYSEEIKKEATEMMRDQYNEAVGLINADLLKQKRDLKNQKRREKRQREKQPKFVRQTLLDRIRFYTKYDFNYVNITNNRQFYDAIIDATNRFTTATSVSIHLKNRLRGNRVRSISLTMNDLASFEEFEDALNRIISGNFVGSDPVDLEEDEIIYDHFALSSALIAGNGNSEDMIFKVEGIVETKREVRGKEVGNGDCSRLCLKKLITDEKILKILDNTPIQELRTLEGMMKFIQKHELPIEIISNSFLLNKNHNEIVKNGEMKRIVIKDKKGMERKYVCSKFEIDEDVKTRGDKKKDVKIVKLLVSSSYYKKTIIYDEVNQHYDVIKNNRIELCDEVYISSCCRVIKDGRILFSPRQMNINNKKESEVMLKYLVFDYETVVDFEKNSCMREYSLSVLNLNNRQLEELTDADIKNDITTVNRIRAECCMTFLGYDCSIEFIKWILANQMDTAFVLIGFNNANFDNFLLLDSLLRYNEDNNEFSVSDIFYNGSSLHNFYICGRHNTFDIRKHLTASLKKNCNDFKINCCAKKNFDHNKTQKLYEEGKLLDYIHGNEELKEYNEYDVLATAVLFCKYRRALDEIEVTKPYASKLHSIKTIGSLIYNVFDDSKKSKKFNLPKLNLKQYQDLQKSKIAGRVELFNGIVEVLERIASTDVCSLYPYVMSVLDVYYPCGEIVETDVYKGDDEIGFYYCDIDQINLRNNNLPKIYARKTEIENDWGHEEILNDYLISNVMIGLLRKYGCSVVVKKGFYFTGKMKSCEMFDFMLDLMKEKNSQDTFKSTKNDLYNSALRETLKLLMNSLSGKVIEGLHCEKTTDVDSVFEYEKILEKCEKVNFINAIGNKIFVTYEIDEDKLINKQRPIYLGVLIYDYAKRYMYEYSYSKIGLNKLLYTDTDASKFRYKDFHDWKNWVDMNNVIVPHWEEVEKVDERYKTHKIYETGSKVFGSFEDELEEMVGENYKFYALEKKSWCYGVDGNEKCRFKGLNDNAIILTLEEDFIGSREINHKNGVNEIKYFIAGEELDVYNFACNNDEKKLGNNKVSLFKKIYDTGEAYLLCNSFRKIVKNSSRNVEIDDKEKYNELMNKIQSNYMIKHIKLKR